jgi:hypothetical protein
LNFFFYENVLYVKPHKRTVLLFAL